MTDKARQAAGRGLPHGLAAGRSRRIESVAYRLELVLPAAPGEPVTGRVRIDVGLMAGAWPPLDFAPGPDDAGNRQALRRLLVDGESVPFGLRDGRIDIEAPPAAAGPHRIEIDFVAGAAGLTRRADLVYSLFVPSRAHTVFPCFDQPDLKGPLELALELPAGWDALGNAPETARTGVGDRLEIQFAATEPLPTYLYAFAAGRLRREVHRLESREIVLLCPPAALPALERNRAEILALEIGALEFLERYTGIAHPFAQTGFVLIPDFEFAGMEHPGAVFYRADLLLQPPDAGLAAAMRRAELVAHETAHLWFGDLVTMRWFDDVWLKEVCASFLADRFVAAQFPAADHATAFMLRHYPAAWAIDRSAGAHAIRQSLDYLGEAAQLYDALIYHKAPIAFAALEREIGAAAMQAGLSRWLVDFRFGSADWPALRARLEWAAGRDLGDFSRRWIDSAGRPPRVDGFDASADLPYAGCRLDESARAGALEALGNATAPRVRAAAWLTLYEDLLDGGIAPAALLTAGLVRLETETDPLIVTRLLADAAEIFWRFLGEPARALAAGPAEQVLRRRAGPGTGRYWLRALARFACSEEALGAIETANASTTDEALDHELTLALALRRPDRAATLVEAALRRARDPDARARLEFLAPALLPDREEHDRLFERLIAGADGRPEPDRLPTRSRWAVTALSLLCHPLRAGAARAYLQPGIAHAAALHAGGDIFLPRQWLEALFAGQGSMAAAAQIRRCVDEPGRSARFRELLLQTADPVFRAARIRGPDE